MIRISPEGLHETEAEALLRPISSELAAVTDAGRQVDRHVGGAVHERLEAQGSLPVGAAVVTPGGDLPVAFIIHVSVQSHEEPVSEAVVGRALLNGLRRAREWEIESLVLPPLGTGAGNLDPETVAGVMIPLLLSHMGEGEHPSSVTLSVPDAYDREVFERVLRDAVAGGEPAPADATGGAGQPGTGRDDPPRESSA